MLDDIASLLRSKAHSNAEDLIHPFPGFISEGDTLNLKGPIVDGRIYELAFDGSDSDAEVLEKSTGLTLLGDSDTPYPEPVPCVVTGNPTTRKQHIARMY